MVPRTSEYDRGAIGKLTGPSVRAYAASRRKGKVWMNMTGSYGAFRLTRAESSKSVLKINDGKRLSCMHLREDGTCERKARNPHFRPRHCGIDCRGYEYKNNDGEHHRPLPAMTPKAQREASAKPVCLVDMLTGRIAATYDNATDAARATGKAPSSVSGMAQTRSFPPTSYLMFRYKSECAGRESKRIDCSVRPVAVFVDGRLRSVYRSSKAAAVAVGVNVKTIESHVAKGTSCNGMLFAKLNRMGEWNRYLIRDNPDIYEGTAEPGRMRHSKFDASVGPSPET